jgi:gliding motility-associated-like protein
MATGAGGCSSSASITITVAEDIALLEGSNVLTPNGDGKNDKLIIKNIDLYPDNMLILFDRAGREIYTKKGYNNEWDGTYQGQPVAEGTYYYIIYLGVRLGQVKGYVSVVRD